MPPKQRITRELVLESALDMVREEGIDSVNARSIAKRLGTSTQPVFSQFATMEELKEAVLRHAEGLYNTAMAAGLQQSGEGFLGMGLAYIRFARTEKNLFRLLFMSGGFQEGSAMNIAGSTEGDPEVIALIGSMTGLNSVQSQRLYTGIWFATHGMASLVATNGCTLEDAEARILLGHMFKGLIHSLQQEQEASPT